MLAILILSCKENTLKELTDGEALKKNPIQGVVSFSGGQENPKHTSKIPSTAQESHHTLSLKHSQFQGFNVFCFPFGPTNQSRISSITKTTVTEQPNPGWDVYWLLV